MPRISIVIPTHNRPDELALTLSAIERLNAGPIFEVGGAEVLVVDNASRDAPEVPSRLRNGFVVRSIRLDENAGAAGRNVGAQEALGEWLLMLDDDSAPLDHRFARACDDAADDVAAIGADILLPDGTRESGGLPEVVVGCGALIRRDAFLDVGGYDASFVFYAEEYDLCAKLLLAGHRVSYDARFRVEHRKVTAGRDMNEVLRRITRNSAWVEQRYAPEHRLDEAIEHLVERYGRIAQKEDAVPGYELGLRELAEATGDQERAPMCDALYDRFTGLAHARAGIQCSRALLREHDAALVGVGKQAWAIESAVAELSLSGDGCDLITDVEDARVLIAGSLSPGPMFDAIERYRARDERVVVQPWVPGLPPVDGGLERSLTVAA